MKSRKEKEIENRFAKLLFAAVVLFFLFNDI